MKTIRILLLDDHLLFRESLSRLLADEPDLEIAAQCSGADEALAVLCSGKEIDLILLDFDLGEENAQRFLTQIRALSFRGRVLLVSAGVSPSETLRALEAGASGLFLKHAPPTELLAAIRRVMRDEALFTPAALAELLEAARNDERRRTRRLELSERERAVLRGVFSGLANKEIAAQLSISEGYVKAVLQQLFGKTGVRTRAQLVRIALEHHVDMGGDPAPPRSTLSAPYSPGR